MSAPSADVHPLASLLSGHLPPGDMNWQAVLKLARRYACAPLLFYQLQQLASISGRPFELDIPADAWQALQADYYAAVGVDAVRERELTRILAAFAKAQVPVLLLKGAALAYQVYARSCLRAMVDLDLLVRSDEVEHACAVMLDLGYHAEPEPAQRFNPFNTAFTGETAFRRAEGELDMVVEVHWELFASDLFRRVSRIDVGELWQRAVPLSIGAAVAIALDPEDTLLHTCLHLSLHGFSHLRGYPDIAQLVNIAALDWPQFVERVKRRRVCLACYFPLWWARQTWQVAVPDEVLRQLRPGSLRVLIGQRLVRRGVRRHAASGHAWEHLVQMMIVDRLSDSVRLIAWLLFPGPAWLQERYYLRTRWQSVIWVAVHPWVVAWEGLRSLAALIRRQ